MVMNNLEVQIANSWSELNKDSSAKLEIMGTTKELLPNKDEILYCRIVLVFKNRGSSFKITDKDNIQEKLKDFMKAMEIKYRE